MDTWERRHKPVTVVHARNRYYVYWPFDKKFMQAFTQEIPPSARHFYSDSKWWHVNQEWWDRAFNLFRSRYYDEDIEVTEEEEPPCEDDRYPLDGRDDDEDWNWEDEEFDLNTGLPPPPVSLDSMSLGQALGILHLVPTADFEDAKVMYRHLSHQAHPDKGGSDTDQTALNRAFSFVENVLARPLTWRT